MVPSLQTEDEHSPRPYPSHVYFLFSCDHLVCLLCDLLCGCFMAPWNFHSLILVYYGLDHHFACYYLLLVIFFCDSKWNVFELWTKQDIRDRGWHLFGNPTGYGIAESTLLLIMWLGRYRIKKLTGPDGSENQPIGQQWRGQTPEEKQMW